MQADPLIQRITLTDALKAQLESVNAAVNNDVRYVPDIVKYGRAEYWENADKAGEEGDCEDEVLAKRQRLRDLGWPQASLDVARCTDEKGEEHAVLIARTDQADMVLDNRQNSVWRWDQLSAFGYTFQAVTVGGSLLEWRSVPEAA